MSDIAEKPEGLEAPVKEEPRVAGRRVKMLMVNPTDFMFLFTKGIEFRKHTKLIKGLPEDAKLISLAAESVRHGIIFVVESATYEEIPAGEMPPIEIVEIQHGKPGATKKKVVPKRKRK